MLWCFGRALGDRMGPSVETDSDYQGDLVVTDQDSRTTASFTAKQGQYLAYIHLYRKLHRRGPSESEIREYFSRVATNCSPDDPYLGKEGPDHSRVGRTWVSAGDSTHQRIAGASGRRRRLTKLQSAWTLTLGRAVIWSKHGDGLDADECGPLVLGIRRADE